MYKQIYIISFISLIISCTSKHDVDGSSSHDSLNTTNQTQVYYRYANPVSSRNLPDPTVIESEGTFFLFSTETAKSMPVMISDDLVNWIYLKPAFLEEDRPSFVEGASIWAPDINFIHDKYVMYYSMSVWGGEWTCGIGVATSYDPAGPYTDLGKLFVSKEINVQNSIDPFYIRANEKNWLFWGSFRGIYAVELSSDGLSLTDFQPIRIAGTAYEATYIHYRNGYYYLFASIGSCCEKLNSTYRVVVGRSQSILGPYVNKEGERMLDNKHELVIKGNDFFKGTGHNAEIITDSNGEDWMLYHAYDVSCPDKGRLLMLDKIEWIEGWPNIIGQEPSLKSDKPIFN